MAVEFQGNFFPLGEVADGHRFSLGAAVERGSSREARLTSRTSEPFLERNTS
jgi:hypothetical protein